MHNASLFFLRPFRIAALPAASSLIAIAITASTAFGSPVEYGEDGIREAAITASAQQSPRLFLADLRTTWAHTSPEALPEQVAAAIRLRPDAAAKITAEAIRLVATTRQAGDGSGCAAAEQIISIAIATNLSAAVAITRRSAEAAPGLSTCIVSAATAQAEDLRLAFIRAAKEGQLMRSIVARTAGESELGIGGLGTINPANVANRQDNGRVRSPEQPPNGNPPHGNPPKNPPHDAPPHDRPRHKQPPHLP